MQDEINKNAKALTVKDLLAIIEQEKLTPDTKIFLSSDEEGNAMYGFAEYGLEGKQNLILYPYNSESYGLYIDQ